MNRNVANKRKRVGEPFGYNKKPRFDNATRVTRWGAAEQVQQQAYFQTGVNSTPAWNYQQTGNTNSKQPRWNNSFPQPAKPAFPPPAPPALGSFPPPVKPATAEIETPEEEIDPEDLKPALPIPPVEAIYAHSTFWHRSIGSVFPLIAQTHFATSHCADVPPTFLPEPPLNDIQRKFSPNPHLFRQKIRPIKAPTGHAAKPKKQKPIKFIHVFQGCHADERLEDICQEWRKKYATQLTYGVNNEDAKALCRNLNLWFGQFCLVCERELSHKSAGPHFRGKSHLRKFQSSPVQAAYERVDPVFVPIKQYVYRATTTEHKKPFPLFGRSHYRLPSFLKSLGFEHKDQKKRILVLGDFDFTFSLGLNRVTHQKNTIVCAPLQLAENDMRIKRNMEQAKKMKIEILEKIELFNPDLLRFDEPFDQVYVLFPRVSFLTNLADPLNSRFSQDLFRNVNRNGIIRPDGYLYVLMKRREFIDWDVCTVALQEKLYLQRAVFHQTGALHPFEPRQHAQSKAKRLNGIKAPLYYIFARTREIGMGGMNPWIEEKIPLTPPKTEKPAGENATDGVKKNEADDADAVLQNLENQMQIKKELPAVKQE